jgi:hypothetical protein
VHTPARACSATGDASQILVLLLFNVLKSQEYDRSSRRHAVRLQELATLRTLLLLHMMQRLLPAFLKGKCICNFEFCFDAGLLRLRQQMAHSVFSI